MNPDACLFGHSVRAFSNGPTLNFSDPVVAAWASFSGSLYGKVLYVASFVIFVISLIAMSCISQKLRRSRRSNLLALAMFTLAVSFMLSNVAVFNEREWIWAIMVVTAADCSLQNLFTLQSRFDYTGRYAALFGVLSALVVFGLTSLTFIVTHWQPFLVSG